MSGLRSLSSVALFSLACIGTWAMLPGFFAVPNAALLTSAPQDSLPRDSSKPQKSLRYTLNPQRPGYPRRRSLMNLQDPSNMQTSVELDTSGKYIRKTMLGNKQLGGSESLSLPEYLKYQSREENQDYFRKRSKAQNFVRGGNHSLNFNLMDLLGSNNPFAGKIEIKPAGSAEVTFGGNFNTVKNPAFTARQQRNGQFDYKQKIQLNVTGKIGDKFNINTNYNTDALFDFEQLMKFNWAGKEDDILKQIEIGNVSMPLNGQLIQGSTNLFGGKVKAQFGRATVTALFSQQKSKTTETEVQGGAQITPFDIQADAYDQNKHYFLAQYFRDHFEEWLSRPPLIQSPILISRVEVWVTNRTGAFDNARDVLAFTDLGENGNTIFRKNIISGNVNVPAPDNGANNLYLGLKSKTGFRSTFSCIQEIGASYPGLKQIEDFQLINFARQLNANEFTLNSRMGYISLNQPLNNDEVLAVAFEFQMNGQVYQVGEFSRQEPTNIQNPNVLFLKLLKPISIRPDLPTWKLMMKNIYSLGSYSIQQKEFKLQVIYADDKSKSPSPWVPAEKLQGVPLVRILNLDRVNVQGEPNPDGQFDWIDGVTVQPQQGRIIFPVLEPFGKFLRNQFQDPNGPTADFYAFDALYDSTRWAAQQQATKNKFFLRGSFQGSASNEISLNSFNIPKGSVRVTANGQPLTENTDYTVDYISGKVKIINQGILNSGATIKVTSENNAFTFQQKTLMGTRLDYKISNDFLIGATMMHLRERPLTPKVGIGEEPMSNSILGTDLTFKSDSRFLTRLIDRLPFIETKEMSNILFTGEAAKLIPGVSPAIKRTLDRTGVSYIDDFEAAENPYDLRLGNYWQLASTPQGQPDLFPDGAQPTALQFREHTARLAWYTLDPLFYSSSILTPDHIRNNLDLLSNHYTREVTVMEIFRNKQVQAGYPGTLPTFDLAYFPNQRGPYNFRANNLNTDGTFKDPANSWAGVMRKIDFNDFEQSNIDYIEFWLMDPFMANHNPNPINGGKLYIQLGNVSEDVLKDSRRSFENGLPKDAANIGNVDSTLWGRVPSLPTINNAFDNQPTSRATQDVGLDGFNDQEERAYFQSFLSDLAASIGTNTKGYFDAANDPSSDNYHYYRGSDFDSLKTDIVQRHKRLNGPDGNSPIPDQKPPHQNKESYPVGITTQPNDEDINRDFTLNEIEEYYQYRVEIGNGTLIVGQNYVTDSVIYDVPLKNGKTEKVTWYQLKVPIRSYERRVGQIPDFKSIRFMRLLLSGFQDSVILRFGAFQLVRADWRKYLFSMNSPADVTPVDPNDPTSFVVSTVNFEENGSRQPVPYVLPPGIFRTIDPTTPNPIQNNEQSLSLRVCELRDGDARAVFKNTQLDIRNYKKIRMFIHAESDRNQVLRDSDLVAFMRIGTDFTNNYYEYEVPLHLTPFGASSDGQVWPEKNEINVDIEEFYRLKVKRIQSGVGTAAYFETTDTLGRKVAVNGIPDMSNLRVIMLGIRNPKQTDMNPLDDGLPKCGEVWFNELRVSDFENPGGWAAIGRTAIKLADLGTMNITGSITTVGFGAIDKKLNERARKDNYVFDINTNLELGRIFPQKLGISIPFYWGYNQNTYRPFFYPLNPDIPLKNVLQVSDPAQRDFIRENAEDFTSRKGWNLTNIRKNRMGTRKPKPYDLENVNMSYSVTEQFKRNQQIAFHLQKSYQLQLNYAFQHTPKKPIEPLKWVGKSKYLQLLRDFNFYPLPQSFSIQTATTRNYAELVNRNNDFANLGLLPDTLYDKNFVNRRQYDLRWDLSRALKFDYNAIAQARIDEPAGVIYTYQGEGRDSIIKNLRKGGRMTDFTHQANLNYTFPFAKFPLTNWINASGRYGVNYAWKTAPPAIGDTVGNVISNSQTISLNGTLNLVQFYNKIKWLEEVNKPGGLKPKPPKVKKKAEPKSKPDPKQKDNPKKKTEEEPEPEIPEELKKSPLLSLAEYTARFVMMLRNVNFTYSSTNGTQLAGFRPKPQFIGQNLETEAPGYDFLFGSQDPAIRYRAAQNGWLTNDSRVTTPFTNSSASSFTARATLEPFPDFRIELNWNRTYNRSFQSFFTYDTATLEFRDFAPLENGSFTINHNFIRSAFQKNGPNESETFASMENQRYTIAQRLQNEDPKSKGSGNDSLSRFYPMGYGPLQQDVLLFSFLSAYGGKSSNNISLNPFSKIPAASWRINYNGLSKLKWFKKHFNNFTLTHNYSSRFVIGNFGTSLRYSLDTLAMGRPLEPKLVMQQAMVQESFSPLIGIDVALKNNFTMRFEYKRDRNITLLLSNPQLMEQYGSEFVIGSGYRTKNLKLPLRWQGRKILLENDVNFRFDFSIRDNWTTIRKFDISPNSVPSAGSLTITIKPTIDYQLSDKMNIRFFFDRRRTKPYTSNSFETAITSVGITARYTLQ